MADYRKSFNFRNGVQVDNDNLVVNSNGLVGVGTTVPTEVLDVRGTARVVGLATADQLNSKTLNVSGVTTLTSASIGNLSISASGIITAVSGVVTFYGDGSTLSNIPTSQWVDVNVGLGFTSIYSAGNVGVGTTDPRSTLQIGGNPATQSGIGINSTGDINATGIITATDFYGTLRGRVKGDVNSTGVSTFTDLKVGTVTVSGGIVTATTFIGGLTGNVVGIATTALGLSGTPDITVGAITADVLTANTINVPSTGIVTATKLLHVGTGGTAFAALEGGRIGVGTAVPTAELQIRKANATLVEVISDNGVASISIGQSVGVGNSTGVLRFGNSFKTLDVINRDTGNINMILHGGGSGIDTGRFDWIYGQTNAELMSLTYDGKLGIGKTNPDTNLHVVGTSTVTGNAWFGGNVTITGTLNAGTFSLPSILSDTNLNVTTGVSTFFSVNLINDLLVDSQIGIGSTNSNPTVDLDAQGKDALFGTVGINTISARSALDVNGTLLVDAIGIGSTSAAGLGYQAISIYDRTVGIEDTAITILNTSLVLDNEVLIGIGTTVARSALDFADAGKGYSTQPFLIPPRLTNAERAGLSTVAGAFIFNTDTSKFQGYTGIAWTDFH